MVFATLKAIFLNPARARTTSTRMLQPATIAATGGGRRSAPTRWGIVATDTSVPPGMITDRRSATIEIAASYAAPHQAHSSPSLGAIVAPASTDANAAAMVRLI
jgi:hypothetical protein